jgi:hypothetical protein
MGGSTAITVRIPPVRLRSAQVAVGESVIK